MKKKLAGILSFIILLSICTTLFAINASSAWLSPLAVEGDLNNNGRLEILDARMALRGALSHVKFQPPSKWPKGQVYGDVNGDGKLTVADARIILRRALNLSDTIAPKYNNDAEIFLSGKYHLVGMIEADGEFLNWNIAMSGNDLYTEMDFEGRSIGILILNDKIYMLNLKRRTYAELSSAFFEKMGLDLEDIKFELPDVSDAVLVSSEIINVDGKDQTVLTYLIEEGSELKFYLDGTSLKTVETFADDNLASKIIVDSISSDVSSVLRIPKGFSRLPLDVFLLGLI